MAQIKKLENTASNNPKLKELLDSVDLNLDDLFTDQNIENKSE